MTYITFRGTELETKDKRIAEIIHPATNESELFKTLARFLQKSQQDAQQTAKKGILSLPPAKMDRGGAILFQNLKKGGFATLVVSGRPIWNPRSKYFESARTAARKGKKITRLFLLWNSHYLREQVVREHWQLDTDAGIKVEFAYIGNWLLKNPLPIGTLDFGIWDREIVCWAVTNPFTSGTSPREWVISRREEDIDQVTKTRDSLLAHRTLDNPHTITQRFTLEEPMLKSAPLMKMLSEVLCKGSYINEEGCGWYHGSWQYFRILDLVSTPTWHSEFYKTALVLKNSNPSQTTSNILVSGAADYSMTAHIIWAYETKSQKCNITVLDLCQTPLWLNKWYGAKKGTQVHIVCSDILEYLPSQKFDYVVTDAFLTRFEDKEKEAVLRKWGDILTDQGKIVTTARIDNAPSPVKASQSQAFIFSEKAVEFAKRWQEFVSLSPEEVRSMARIYAENMISYPFKNLEEIERLFIRCGFVFTHIEEAILKGEMMPTKYAEVIAAKNI